MMLEALEAALPLAPADHEHDAPAKVAYDALASQLKAFFCKIEELHQTYKINDDDGFAIDHEVDRLAKFIGFVDQAVKHQLKIPMLASPPKSHIWEAALLGCRPRAAALADLPIGIRPTPLLLCDNSNVVQLKAHAQDLGANDCITSQERRFHLFIYHSVIVFGLVEI
jgi:hypothetical protein